MIHRILIAIVVLSAVPTSSLQAQGNVKITADVVYGHKYGLALTMDVFQPQKSNGAGVVFMVSGGWYSRWSPPKSTVRRFQSLLDAGFTVFAVRHGSSPKFGIPEAVADVRRGVRFIRSEAKRFGVDPERLGVFGGSAGGHLSLMLGTTADKGNPDATDDVLKQSSRVAAVVAYFPPTDLRGMVWKAPKHDPQYDRFPALNLEVKDAATVSPLLAVTSDDAPTLLIHGDKDRLVPIDHSTKILAAFQKAKVTSELITIEGAAHGFRGKDGERANAALVRWFEQHLKKKK